MQPVGRLYGGRLPASAERALIAGCDAYVVARLPEQPATSGEPQVLVEQPRGWHPGREQGRRAGSVSFTE